MTHHSLVSPSLLRLQPPSPSRKGDGRFNLVQQTNPNVKIN